MYDDLRPRALTAEDLLRAPRPSLAQVEDVELDLRALGGGVSAGQEAAGEGAAGVDGEEEGAAAERQG